MQIKPDEITSILRDRIEGLDDGGADLSEEECDVRHPRRIDASIPSALTGESLEVIDQDQIRGENTHPAIEPLYGCAPELVTRVQPAQHRVERGSSVGAVAKRVEECCVIGEKRGAASCIKRRRTRRRGVKALEQRLHSRRPVRLRRQDLSAAGGSKQKGRHH